MSLKQFVCFSLFVTIGLGVAEHAVAQHSARSSHVSLRAQLAQLVTQLQSDPSDDALREQIIQLALKLHPKPAVPAEAIEAAAKGKVIFDSITTPADAKAAATAYAQASLLAPWVPQFYYNQGVALEKAGQFDDAVHALNLYLTAAPNASDADAVRGRIDAIGYEKQKEAQATQRAAQQQMEAAQAKFAQEFGGKWCGTGSAGQGTYKVPAQSDCIWIDSPNSVRATDQFTLGGSWAPGSIEILGESSSVTGAQLQGDDMTFTVAFSLAFWGHCPQCTPPSAHITYAGDEEFTVHPSYDGTKLEGTELVTATETENHGYGTSAEPDQTLQVTFVRQ